MASEPKTSGDEIGEALDRAPSDTEVIVMTGSPHGHWAVGSTEEEALETLHRVCGCTDPEEKAIGRFSEPVSVVVDILGRPWWKPGTATLEWDDTDELEGRL